MLQRKKNTAPPYEWRNIPTTFASYTQSDITAMLFSLQLTFPQKIQNFTTCVP